MSQVKNEEQLFDRIEELQEELRKLIHEYLEYIGKRKRRVKKTKKSVKTPAQIERENDTQCMALLKSGKRCSGKKTKDEAGDVDLCKRHNNPKFEGKIDKIKLPPLTEDDSDNNEDDEDDEYSYDDSSDDGIIQVKLSVDADGDTIDTEGNIWCMDKQLVIGKKDLHTKQKVFFKTV